MPSPMRRWVELFRNNPDVFAIQQNSGSYLPSDWDTTAKKRSLEPVLLSADTLRKHFEGQQTLGFYAIGPDNTCRWMCWDLDEEDDTPLIKIAGWLAAHGFHPLREGRRLGRAGHLWVFFDQPVRSQDAYRLAEITKSELFLPKIEVFPKQEQLSGDHISHPGNLVRLPLGRHQKVRDDNFFGWFDGCEQKYEAQIQYLLKQPLSPTSKLADLIERLKFKVETKVRKKRHTEVAGDLLTLLPPDWPIVHLPTGECRTKCPVCAEIGQDKGNSNLYIKSDGKVMFCHYNSGDHTFEMILRAFRQLQVQPGDSL